MKPFQSFFAIVVFTFSFTISEGQNWSENFENYPIRDSSYKYGYSWQATSIATGGMAITSRSILSSPLNNPASPGKLTTGYFQMTATSYNITLQTKVSNLSSNPVLTVFLVDIFGVEVATIHSFTYPGTSVQNVNFNFTGLSGWYQLRFVFSGSGGGSRATIDNISSTIPAVTESGSSTRLSDIQTTVQISGTDCNSQIVTVRFTNNGPDPAFAYGITGTATLHSLTGINYSSYSTSSPNLRLDPLTNTLHFFDNFSVTGLGVGQFLELTINLNTPGNCNVSLGSTFNQFNIQVDQIPPNNSDYQNISFAILPVSFSTLSADISDDHVKLSWIAYNERNASHYTIEKSTDGLHFYSIGSMPAKGIDAPITQYEYTDQSQDERVYYRVILNDLDGKKTMSKVIVVNHPSKVKGVDFYPNPVKKSGQIYLSTQANENISIELFDASGKIIFSKKFNSSRRTLHTISLPMHIHKGQYWLRLMANDQLSGVKPLMIVD